MPAEHALRAHGSCCRGKRSRLRKKRTTLVPMTTPEAGRPRSPATTEQVDAVMQAVHALAGITAQSVAEVEYRVTLPQLRVLILISEDAGLNLSTLARALGVHPPTRRHRHRRPASRHHRRHRAGTRQPPARLIDVSPAAGTVMLPRAAVPAPPSWPWRRAVLFLARAAQLITIHHLGAGRRGSPPVTWASVLLTIAPAPLAAVAAFAPPRSAGLLLWPGCWSWSRVLRRRGGTLARFPSRRWWPCVPVVPKLWRERS
jgi:hypothetical protein